MPQWGPKELHLSEKTFHSAKESRKSLAAGAHQTIGHGGPYTATARAGMLSSGPAQIPMNWKPSHLLPRWEQLV